MLLAKVACASTRYVWGTFLRWLDSVAFVTSDGPPLEAGRQLSEDLRQRAIAVLQELFANGKVDENGFQRFLDGLLRISSESELASMMRSLPLPVAFTPPAQRRQEPLQITTSMGEVRLEVVG